MSSYQIIKLKNGEDLICNVLDNENGRLKVTTPLKMETVNRISKKGLTESLALTRWIQPYSCLLYTSPSPRDLSTSRMPSSA